MNICEEHHHPDRILPVGTIPALPGTFLPHSGDLLMPDDQRGFVLPKMDGEWYIKQLTILPFFSADAIRSCAGQFVVM